MPKASTDPPATVSSVSSDGSPREGAATLVVFSLDGQRYALPLPRVERVLPMVWISPLPEAPAIVVGAVSLGGRVLPVLDIRRRLGLRPRPWGLASRLLVARTARFAIALPVDEVISVGVIRVEDAVTRPFSAAGGRIVSGIAGLADGLLYICDLDAFLSLDEEERLTRALAEGAS